MTTIKVVSEMTESVPEGARLVPNRLYLDKGEAYVWYEWYDINGRRRRQRPWAVARYCPRSLVDCSRSHHATLAAAVEAARKLARETPL